CDPDFIKSLQVLRKEAPIETDEPWQARIAQVMKHFRDVPSANASWMLYRNGNVCRVDLVISNIYIPDKVSCSLTLRQKTSGFSCDCNVPDSSKRYFCLSDLLAKGLNPTEKILLLANNKKLLIIEPIITLFQPNKPVIFRYPLNAKNNWLPMIDNKDIYARRLIVVSTNNGNATLNGNPIPSREIGNCDCGVDKRHLYQVEINDELTEKLPFKWDNSVLCNIGSKPYLNISTPAEACPDNRADKIVLGDTAEITSHNQIKTEIEWSLVDGDIISQDANKVKIRSQYGQTVSVRHGDARLKILFLPPPEILTTIGWKWGEDELPAEDLLENGRMLKTLLSPDDQQFKLVLPFNEIYWWWQQILGEPEAFNKPKDFDDHSHLSCYRLKIWIPTNITGSLSFYQQKCHDLNPGINVIDVNEILPESFKFENPGEEIDELTINDSLVVAYIIRIPRHPVLRLASDIPQVFCPSNCNPEQYRVVCFYESGIKDDTIEVISCRGFSRENAVNVISEHKRSNDEGIWLALIEAQQEFPASLIGLLLERHDLVSVIPWHCPGTTMVKRLGLENEKQQTNARGRLNILDSQGKKILQHGIFTEAVEARDSLDFGNSSEFWDQCYVKYCQIECSDKSRQPAGSKTEFPLEKTLTLMLQTGFNWCAEPNWLHWAYNQVKSQYSRWTSHRDKVLNAICPLITAQEKIEAGKLPRGQTNNGIFNHSILNPLQNMWEICLPDSEAPLYRDGLCLWNNNGNAIAPDKFYLGHKDKRDITFSYHRSNTMRDPYGEFLPYQIRLCKDQDENFFRFICRIFHNDNFIFSDDVDNENAVQIEDIFKDSFIPAREILGNDDDRMLGHMFKLAALGLQDNGGISQAMIFRLAFLCRMHAWLGWNKTKYPEEWPMKIPQNYDRVCHLVLEIWYDQEARLVFMKDMVHIEWLLAWFHK
ncbi:MAG: hypothetical protein PHV82_08540, partial [Victivallaceae bacterium]|nr:hypothetical protein [Victivallaceae bacterium]